MDRAINPDRRNDMSDTKRKPASILKEFAAEMKRLFERVKK
jgi:hypothetical protein